MRFFVILFFVGLVDFAEASQENQIIESIKESYNMWMQSDWNAAWMKYTPGFRKRCDREDMVSFLTTTKKERKIASIEVDGFSIVMTEGKNAAMVTYNVHAYDRNKNTIEKKRRSLLIEQVNGKWLQNERCYPSSKKAA